MSRTKIEWRMVSTNNYKLFRKSNPEIKISIDKWKEIIYLFNYNFRDVILETGDKLKLPNGFGELSINKKKRKHYKISPTGEQYINLPIDWQKTKEKGKRIYNFNHHSEGYFFGWTWFKPITTLKHSLYWYFKPSRVSSRMINHYLKIDDKYQHLYKEWNIKSEEHKK